MSDTNYKPLDFANIHGTSDRWIEVLVDARDPEEWVITGHPNPAMNDTHPAPDMTHSDTIKVSGCSYLRVIVTGRLRGGVEDCLDVNNKSEHIEIHADEWESGGLFVATLKGGSKFIRLTGCIVKHGSEMDIDLGNWSDQSMERTRYVMLRLECLDAVRYRVLHAWEPVLENAAIQKYKGCLTWKGVFHAVMAILKTLHLA